MILTMVIGAIFILAWVIYRYKTKKDFKNLKWCLPQPPKPATTDLSHFKGVFVKEDDLKINPIITIRSNKSLFSELELSGPADLLEYGVCAIAIWRRYPAFPETFFSYAVFELKQPDEDEYGRKKIVVNENKKLTVRYESKITWSLSEFQRKKRPVLSVLFTVVHGLGWVLFFWGAFDWLRQFIN